MTVGLVTLDPAVVADYAAGAGGLHPAGLEFTGMQPVSVLMAAHWQSVVRYVVRDVLPNAEAMASALIRGQTQRLLAASLLATFPNTALEALTTPQRVRSSRLRCAARWRSSTPTPAEDIGIAEIAEAARIGPRGLQRAFRQYRDTTPMKYLHRVRLDHAHRELLAETPAGVTPWAPSPPGGVLPMAAGSQWPITQRMAASPATHCTIKDSPGSLI